MVWMLLSMNMHAVDAAINEFFMHAVDVALNEVAWCGCCSQRMCIAWTLFSTNLHGAVDVALNEFAWCCGCCSQ